jgi:thymidylate synthase
MNDFLSPADAAVSVAHYVAERGAQSAPRNMPVRECLWVDFNVANPEFVPLFIENRDLNNRYQALEVCSLLSGMPVDTIQRNRAKGFAKFQVGGIQRGNYGVRIRNQLRDLVVKLTGDRYSRQAVLTIFDGDRDMLDWGNLDIPCTLAVQVMIRGGQLFMRTTMRSNDVYLGLPYDLMQFCTLQCTLAQVFRVTPGFYRHSVGSMHAYEKDLPAIEKMQVAPDEHEYDDPWAIPDELVNPVDRLEWVTTWCQEILYGDLPLVPRSNFEHWLAESL